MSNAPAKRPGRRIRSRSAPRPNRLSRSSRRTRSTTTSFSTRTSTAVRRSLPSGSARSRRRIPATPRWWTAGWCSCGASTRTWSATRGSSSSARTSESSATSTSSSRDCRQSTASSALSTPAYARRRSWGRGSARPFGDSGRSWTSSTSTTCSTRSSSRPTTSRRCTGAPAMATIVSSLRGLHVAVPRDMTRAAGLYNTLLRGDDPALLIEVLSGYRLKERLPENVGEFTIPLGVTETLRSGSDVTLVTYGALCRIAMEAAEDLASVGIETEIIDVQTLLPFDRDHAIAESVEKTRALLVVDEDVPGGASAYIVREVVETQGAIDHLDVGPRTLTGAANRVAVGNDGDYFSKPNREDIFETVYAIMRERRPDDVPPIMPWGRS